MGGCSLSVHEVAKKNPSAAHLSQNCCKSRISAIQWNRDIVGEYYCIEV